MPTSTITVSKLAPSLTQSLNSQIMKTADKDAANQHTCLCCSHILLRHIKSGNVYWRCSHCR